MSTVAEQVRAGQASAQMAEKVEADLLAQAKAKEDAAVADMRRIRDDAASTKNERQMARAILRLMRRED